MEYTQEKLQELITGITPEVLEQEEVYAGYRPLVRLYRLPDGTAIQERNHYLNPANSEAWANCNITLTLIQNV